jgi:hypothetical protein
MLAKGLLDGIQGFDALECQEGLAGRLLLRADYRRIGVQHAHAVVGDYAGRFDAGVDLIAALTSLIRAVPRHLSAPSAIRRAFVQLVA